MLEIPTKIAMACSGYTTPEAKAKREPALEQMRARFKSPAPILAGKNRSRINARNASGPHPWARGPLSYMIEGMKPGESAWFARKSPAVHRAAKTARRKIVTRTVFRNGEQGVRVTVVK